MSFDDAYFTRSHEMRKKNTNFVRPENRLVSQLSFSLSLCIYILYARITKKSAWTNGSFFRTWSGSGMKNSHETRSEIRRWEKADIRKFVALVDAFASQVTFSVLSNDAIRYDSSLCKLFHRLDIGTLFFFCLLLLSVRPSSRKINPTIIQLIFDIRSESKNKRTVSFSAGFFLLSWIVFLLNHRCFLHGRPLRVASSNERQNKRRKKKEEESKEQEEGKTCTHL